MKHKIILSVSITLVIGIFCLAKISLAANQLEVVINEVAWMGTTISANDEWLELKNNTDVVINLTGWTLRAQDGTPNIALSGTITGQGYFLLERTDDESVPGVPADLIYNGALGNEGEILELRDNLGNLIDTIDCSGGWFSGDNTNKYTMERTNSASVGSSDNWHNSSVANGTPGAQNSSPLPPANNPPTAVAGEDQTAAIGELVYFDGSGSSDSDGSIIDYLWNFGDDSSGSDATTTHLYLSENIFTVSLTVTDDDGATNSDVLTVTVSTNTSTPTSTPPVIYPADVIINEFAADAVSGEQEWIELFNNTTSTINLANWTMEDGVGKILDLTGEILAQGFLVFELAASKLNNGGDIIILKDDSGQIIDEVAYGDWNDGDLSENAPMADKGESIARRRDGADSDDDIIDFALTATPTKNAANLITPRPVPPSAGSGGGGGGNSTDNLTGPPLSTNYRDVKIIINEILPNPQGIDSENEFIELKNIGATAVDLAGWVLADSTAKKYIICRDAPPSASWRSGFCVSAIQPSGFFVVKRSDSQIALNNSGKEQIKLFSPDGVLVDLIEYEGKAEEDESYSRDKKGKWSWTVTPTSAAENIITLAAEKTEEKISQENEQVILPIIISEVLPNPVGPDSEGEFIEFYNHNEEEVDLSGWLIDDGEGGSRLHKIKAEKIKPFSYLILWREKTGLTFNNDFDSVRLFDFEHELVDEVEYEDASEGLSYALNSENEWQWTARPTPGRENVFVESPKQEEEKIASAKTNSSTKKKSMQLLVLNSLAEIRELAVGARVMVKGVVAVEPGVLGSQIFYLAGSGVQVYSYKKDFPALKVGDYIEVVGEISEAGGERRLKIAARDDIKFLEKKEAPRPKELPAGEIGELDEGHLIKVSGEVLEVKGNNIYLDDGADEVKIYIKNSTGIDIGGIKEGDLLTVTGLVSQTASGYRLLPRYQSDIIKGEVKGAVEKSSALIRGRWEGINKYLIALIIFLLTIVVWLFWQQYKLKKNGWQIVEEK